jgi:hypothetical protein
MSERRQINVASWVYDVLEEFAKSSPIVLIYKNSTKCKSYVVALVELVARIVSDEVYRQSFENLLLKFTLDRPHLLGGDEVRKKAVQQLVAEKLTADTAIRRKSR